MTARSCASGRRVRPWPATGRAAAIGPTANRNRTDPNPMPTLADRLRRAREASALLALAQDWRSRAALLACYGTLLRDVHDRREVAVRLRGTGRELRMRRCDILTLGEIFAERQYAIDAPLPERPVIVDAGANIGVTALWFLSRYPGARLHAFEPEPENFRLLEANFGGDPDVVLNRAGLLREPGVARFHLSPHAPMHSFRADADAGAGESIEVDAFPLGAYLRDREIARVDLLKLDVEGSELDVLVGLGDEVARVGRIVGEVHERLVDVAAFYAALERAGFAKVRRIDFIDGAHEGVHGFEAARA